MNIEIANNKFEKVEVEKFLSTFNLKYDDVDYTIVIRNNDKIVATASKKDDIIKCFAISDEMQGEGLTNLLVSHLLNKIFEEGKSHAFVFTKPKNIEIFKNVGFSLIATTDKVALLEIGDYDIKSVITRLSKDYNIDTQKNHSMIVMNANPFTLGHRYLCEYASSHSEEVLLFVVSEDASYFKYEDRLNMIKQGIDDLKNIKVLPSTEYIISRSTFPNYFLKQDDDTLLEYIKLDLTITGEWFCKMLNIHTRFVGSEPTDTTTRKYNEIMQEILPKYGVNVKILPRKEYKDTVISATTVREFYQNNDFKNLKNYVPNTTFEYLQKLRL